MFPFQLSLGARSALSLLNTLDENQLYLTTLPGREEVWWVFRLLFQLCGQSLPDDKEAAWAVCRTFLASGKETGLENKVMEAVATFNFSNENIDLVEAVLGNRTDKLNPNSYSAFCGLSGIVMFAVKEGLAYAGLIPEKTQPWRKYQRLLYRRKQLSKQ